MHEQLRPTPKLEIRTPLIIDQRYIDRYDHLWHLGSLALFEEERYRLLENRGIGADVIEREHGLKILVAKMKNINYKSQVVYGDKVEIYTAIDNSHASLTVDQKMIKGGIDVVKASYAFGFVDGKGRPRRIPESVLEKLYTPPKPNRKPIK